MPYIINTIVNPVIRTSIYPFHIRVSDNLWTIPNNHLPIRLFFPINDILISYSYNILNRIYQYISQSSSYTRVLSPSNQVEQLRAYLSRFRYPPNPISFISRGARGSFQPLTSRFRCNAE